MCKQKPEAIDKDIQANAIAKSDKCSVIGSGKVIFFINAFDIQRPENIT